MDIKTFKILILLISISFCSCGQKKPDKKVIVTTLDADYLEGCETGKGDCKPIEIFRQTKQDSLLLVFPSGGTISDVYLRSKDIKVDLHDKKTAGQGNPQLNMTGLADGEYSANIISCGLGGACLIKLKTKSQ